MFIYSFNLFYFLTHQDDSKRMISEKRSLESGLVKLGKEKKLNDAILLKMQKTNLFL